jgi:hypothetical protein
MARRRPFWTRPLGELTREEWERLCDGCGKCCLVKLEDEETGRVHYTSVACRLFDEATCRCSQYALRRLLVPTCVVLTPENIGEVKDWMPKTCAYRLRAEGKPLYPWHPLLSGDPESVARAGHAIRGRTVPEWEVPEDELEDHVIEDDI